MLSLLAIAGVISFIKNIEIIYPNPSIFLLTLLTINIVFILYFWLSGTKDIVYIIFYYLKKNRINKRELNLLNQPVTTELVNANVYLVYCTCDDFNEESLRQSMKQTHTNVQTFILDDSTMEEMKQTIDLFSEQHQVTVVRREDKSGFKAGNLKNTDDNGKL